MVERPFVDAGEPQRSPETLGIPAASTFPSLQSDAFKELINKLAWALGSTYRTRYSGTRSPTRVCALKMAQEVMRDQGYPRHIAKT